MKTILILFLLLGTAFAILPSCPDNSILDYTSCVCVPTGEQPKPSQQISGGGGGEAYCLPPLQYDEKSKACIKVTEITCSISCPAGQYLDTDTCACYTPTPACSYDEYLDTDTNTCKVIPNQIIRGIDNGFLMLGIALTVIICEIAYFFTTKPKKFKIPEKRKMK